MWKWIIGIALVIIIIIIIYKMKNNRSNVIRADNLDGRLNSIKSNFSEVCAKLLRRIGC